MKSKLQYWSIWIDLNHLVGEAILFTKCRLHWLWVPIVYYIQYWKRLWEVHPLNKKFIHSEFLRYYEAPPRFSFALTFKTGIIASFDYSKIVYSIYEHRSLQIRSIIHCNLGQIPTIRSLYFLQGVASTIIQSQYNNSVLWIEKKGEYNLIGESVRLWIWKHGFESRYSPKKQIIH